MHPSAPGQLYSEIFSLPLHQTLRGATVRLRGG